MTNTTFSKILICSGALWVIGIVGMKVYKKRKGIKPKIVEGEPMEFKKQVPNDIQEKPDVNADGDTDGDHVCEAPVEKEGEEKEDKPPEYKPPYPITSQMYHDTRPEFEKQDIMFYKLGSTFVNPENMHVYNRGEEVENFGRDVQFDPGERAVYIRNEKISTDFMIVQIEGAWVGDRDR